MRLTTVEVPMHKVTRWLGVVIILPSDVTYTNRMADMRGKVLVAKLNYVIY